MSAERVSILKTVISLALDYLRWTQLAPLITVWGFALLMIAVMLFINYEEQSWGAIGAVFQWMTGLPLIGPRLMAWMESLAGEDGTISLGGNELKAAALKAWTLLSLTFMLVSLAINWLFGPFQPWPLKRKLGVAALCCLVFVGGFVVLSFSHSSNLDEPVGNWFLSSAGMAVVLFLINLWCLSVAHLLGLIRQAISESSLEEHSGR